MNDSTLPVLTAQQIGTEKPLGLIGSTRAGRWWGGNEMWIARVFPITRLYVAGGFGGRIALWGLIPFCRFWGRPGRQKVRSAKHLGAIVLQTASPSNPPDKPLRNFAWCAVDTCRPPEMVGTDEVRTGEEIRRPKFPAVLTATGPDVRKFNDDLNRGRVVE